MRTPPIPAFQAAPDEPILCAFEVQRAPAATPSEDLRLPGRKELRPRVEYYYRQLKALPRRLRRTLQRRYARSLAGVALLLALGQAPALAATINVGGGCTLVDAITAANTDATAGGCPAGSGADVIALTGDVTLTAVNNTTAGPNGLPSVTSTITLNGGDHTVQRSTVTGTPEFRLLHVADSGDLTLNQITLTNGRAASLHRGGGVFNAGTVALNDSTVSGNTANSGGGVWNTGTLTLTNSTVSNNTVEGIYTSGGGVENFGYLTFTDSTVSGNSADRGGGVKNFGYLTFTDSTVSGNTAELGGGVENFDSLTLTDSTVSGNTAQLGGGVFHFLADDCQFATPNNGATLTNSTISGNNASRGGGLAVYGDPTDCGAVTLANSTVSGNTASDRGGGILNLKPTSMGYVRYEGPISFVHSLISGNTSPTGPEVDNASLYGGGTVFADNFNLFGVNGDAGVVGFTPGATDIVPVSGVTLADILDPLADNGGPTQTHALVLGSPASDVIPIDKDCAIKDQRGAFRPQGSACDIGAFELGVEPDPFVSPTPSAGCTVNGVPGQLCRGTAGPDRILGTTGNDVIVGLAGNDYVNGSSGEDRVFGGEDNDRLIGGNGDDQIFGQQGDDDLRGYAGNDLLEGGDGNDRLKGHEGDDQLRGGNGDDALRGLAGGDILDGGTGNDLLRGGADSDDLNGGPGADVLNGGGSFDFCESDAEDKLVVFCP